MATTEKQARERAIVEELLRRSRRPYRATENVLADRPDVVADLLGRGTRWFEVTEVSTLGDERPWQRDLRVSDYAKALIGRPESAGLRAHFTDALITITFKPETSENLARNSITPLMGWLESHPDASGNQWHRIDRRRPPLSWASRLRTVTVSRGHTSGPRLICLTAFAGWHHEEVQRIVDAIERKSRKDYRIPATALELVLNLRGGLSVNHDLEQTLVETLRGRNVPPTFDAVSFLYERSSYSIESRQWL